MATSSRNPTHLPTFPAQSAFVVQWHRTAHLTSGKVMGRVEHVVTRQATTFDSWNGLLAFMQGVLDRDPQFSEKNL